MLNENNFVDEQDNHSTNGKPIREGQPAGGQKFGENNTTPSGDDKNNPSQNAGYSNEYFRRTEPSEEHPENTNFKPSSQEGAPDYDSAQPYGQSSDDSQTESESQQNDYQEGTADKGSEHDTSVPDELPEPPKIGQDDNIL